MSRANSSPGFFWAPTSLPPSAAGAVNETMIADTSAKTMRKVWAKSSKARRPLNRLSGRAPWASISAEVTPEPSSPVKLMATAPHTRERWLRATRSQMMSSSTAPIRASSGVK
jgi:hypothetical protein